MNSKRVTVKEAAKQLEVSLALVRQMCQDGDLGKVVNGLNGKKVYLIYQHQIDRIKK